MLRVNGRPYIRNRAFSFKGIASQLKVFTPYFKNSVISHVPVFVITMVYLLIALLVAQLEDVPEVKIDFLKVFFQLSFLSLTLAGVIYVIGSIGRMLLYTKPRHPLLQFYQDVKQFISMRTAANFLPLMIAMAVFAITFSYFKLLIPILNPFSWDELFMKADKILHFGNHPYVLIDAAIGSPHVIIFLNIVYNLWFAAVWGFWAWLGLKDHSSTYRMRFMIAFILVWSVGGSLLAIIFSSAGPCYYGLVGNSPDIYEPLMSALGDVNKDFPLWAIATQQNLWNSYTGENQVFLGISAMPSMHNGVIDLVAIASFYYNRFLGWCMSIYATLIFIGSVALGWHYAIDGYAGLVLAFVFWWVAGRVVEVQKFGEPQCVHS